MASSAPGSLVLGSSALGELFADLPVDPGDVTPEGTMVVQAHRTSYFEGDTIEVDVILRDQQGQRVQGATLVARYMKSGTLVPTDVPVIDDTFTFVPAGPGLYAFGARATSPVKATGQGLVRVDASELF